MQKLIARFFDIMGIKDGIFYDHLKITIKTNALTIFIRKIT